MIADRSNTNFFSVGSWQEGGYRIFVRLSGYRLASATAAVDKREEIGFVRLTTRSRFDSTLRTKNRDYNCFCLT